MLCNCWSLTETTSHLCSAIYQDHAPLPCVLTTVWVTGVQGHTRVSHSVNSQGHRWSPSCPVDKDSPVTHCTSAIPCLVISALCSVSRGSEPESHSCSLLIIPSFSPFLLHSLVIAHGSDPSWSPWQPTWFEPNRWITGAWVPSESLPTGSYEQATEMTSLSIQLHFGNLE